MSENQLITGDSDELLDKKNFPEINTKHSYKKIIIIISAILVAIAIAAVVIILIKRNKDEEKKDEGGKKDEEKYPNIEYNISTIQFPPDIIYIGSHYNYQDQIFLVYKKKNFNNYYFGIANEEGEILKEIYELTNTTGMYVDYIQRISSFDDGKRAFIGGKILQCTKEFINCDDAKLYDIEFPEQIKNIPNLNYLYTEPIISIGGEYIFWSTFDTDMNIFNFVGKLIFKNDKYYIEEAVGISNYFYDLYDKEKDTYSLPNILRFGPIKQMIEGGKGLSIGGFLNYGLRKGIYQSLSEDKLTQLTNFEGYDETTTLSPDSKLACVMTTRFSPTTSLEIIGFIPTPYSILASYLLSMHTFAFYIGRVRNKIDVKGNIGPALVYLEKMKIDKEYKGYNLNTDDNWNFNGFTSWSPNGKKFMFDEISKTKERRCQIVNLKNYIPDKIKIENNFNGYIPYNRSIEETLKLHLDFPINTKVNGKSGYLEINRTQHKCEINYYNYTEDSKTTFNGIYNYETFPEQKYTIFEVNITSSGEKNGYCEYRLWYDNTKNIFIYDKGEDGIAKTFGDCEYENKKINVSIYEFK